MPQAFQHEGHRTGHSGDVHDNVIVLFEEFWYFSTTGDFCGPEKGQDRGGTGRPEDGNRMEMEGNRREVVIEVEHLEARYGKRTILSDVNLRVYRREILCIVGGSGCGKSTLLKHMIGLLPPYRGRIIVDGVDISTQDEDAMERLRRSIGVLFQSDALFGSMTLAENVALPLGAHTALTDRTIREVVRMKLGLVNLAGCENLYPAELSGGMRKRGALARAIALDPTILFFDEPSAGLDPVTAGELMGLIKSINAGMGTTMVIVSHQLEFVFTVADRVIMLDGEARGIIAEGTPREITEHAVDPRVRAFFRVGSAPAVAGMQGP